MDTGKTIALIKAFGGSGGGGGGSDLPAVTSDDNGDVLTVVDGAWDKATPSGGIVVLHMDESTGALDKTWNEIHTLFGAGTMMFLVVPYSGYPGGFVGDIVKYVFENEGDYVVSFNEFFATATAANDYPVLDED